MATLELEPDFVKGLRFMLSSSRDAAESLRSMLDDAIRAKYGSSKSLGSFQPKVKLDEVEYTSQILTERHSEDSCSSKEDDEGDLNLDLIEEDLACAVCRDMNVGPRNRLVECCECHSLYHQECHRPPIAEQDISDPRNTWYCSTCSRLMHRNAEATSSSANSSKLSMSSSSKVSSNKQPFKTSGQSGSTRDSPTNTKPASSNRSDVSSDKSSLFKRTDKASSGTSSSNSSSSKSAPSGLAALAASLQSSSKSSSSVSNSSHSHKSSSSGFAATSTGSSKSSSSSKDNYSSSSKSFSSSGGSANQSSKGAPSSPTLSGINADRRLQIMKKKAAKMQEKRKHSK